MSKQLVLIPRSCKVSSKDKEKMSKNGFLPVEVDFAGEVRIVSSLGAEFGGSEMLLMALKAINESNINSRDGIRERFTHLLAAALQRQCGATAAKSL